MIGLAAGWRAAQRGLGVTLIERAATGQATSRVAAGMIAPISEASPFEPELLALGRESANRYPAFVDELTRLTGLDPGYRRFGTLLVARDADEAEALDREFAFRRDLGLPVTRLLGREARGLEPSLAPTLRLALDIPDDHAIDPRALTRALDRALREAGAQVRCPAEVSELVVADGRVRGVRLDGGELISAEHVVMAAGPWSGLIAGLPPQAQIPLRPVKGQILALRDPAGPGLLGRVLRMQPGYLVPRGDGRYVLGASVEERGFDTTATAGAVFELLRDAIELVPGVSELVIEEVMVGTRPGTADNGPALGPGTIPGLHWATGHHRHGILLTPVTADVVVAGLFGEAAPEVAEPFRATRFAADRVEV